MRWQGLSLRASFLRGGRNPHGRNHHGSDIPARQAPADAADLSVQPENAPMETGLSASHARAGIEPARRLFRTLLQPEQCHPRCRLNRPCLHTPACAPPLPRLPGSMPAIHIVFHGRRRWTPVPQGQAWPEPRACCPGGRAAGIAVSQAAVVDEPYLASPVPTWDCACAMSTK